MGLVLSTLLCVSNTIPSHIALVGNIPIIFAVVLVHVICGIADVLSVIIIAILTPHFLPLID